MVLMKVRKGINQLYHSKGWRKTVQKPRWQSDKLGLVVEVNTWLTLQRRQAFYKLGSGVQNIQICSVSEIISCCKLEIRPRETKLLKASRFLCFAERNTFGAKCTVSYLLSYLKRQQDVAPSTPQLLLSQKMATQVKTRQLRQHSRATCHPQRVSKFHLSLSFPALHYDSTAFH